MQVLPDAAGVPIEVATVSSALTAGVTVAGVALVAPVASVEYQYVPPGTAGGTVVMPSRTAAAAQVAPGAALLLALLQLAFLRCCNLAL